jgi:hypothetical protein
LAHADVFPQMEEDRLLFLVILLPLQ